MHRLAGDEGFGAVGEAAEAKGLAGLELLALSAEVGVDTSFVAGLRLRGQHGDYQYGKQKGTRKGSHDFFFACFVDACFFLPGFFEALVEVTAIPFD